MSETGYDETPEDTSGFLEEFAQSGFINIVGGCCGTTPDHMKALVKKVKNLTPRTIPTVAQATRLSGLEALNIGENAPFIMVGERTKRNGLTPICKAC